MWKVLEMGPEKREFTNVILVPVLFCEYKIQPNWIHSYSVLCTCYKIFFNCSQNGCITSIPTNNWILSSQGFFSDISRNKKLLSHFKLNLLHTPIKLGFIMTFLLISKELWCSITSIGSQQIAYKIFWNSIKYGPFCMVHILFD
jgi:hypothetical protein